MIDNSYGDVGKGEPRQKSDTDLRAMVLGEWLPLDTIRGIVYANHHNAFFLSDDNGIYLSNPLADDNPDKCIREEYDIEKNTCTFYFVYASYREEPDYGYMLNVVDDNMLEWRCFYIKEDGTKDINWYKSYTTIRRGYEHKYALYNSALPDDIKDRAWFEIENYRGDFYFSDNESLPFMKAYEDSIAVRDAYNGALAEQMVKHCYANVDTTFIYGVHDNTPSFRIIWIDKEQGIILFCHPWEDLDFAGERVLVDSVKYTKDLLPTLEMLLEQDLERVAFFEKWRAKGYEDKEIEHFMWYRESSPSILEKFAENEDSYYDDRSGETLQEFESDYNGDGLVDRISLVEDWLYEKDINHDHLDYTIVFVKTLEERVSVVDQRVKVRRPMLEDFSINIPADGVLELKYDVYARRGYDTWEYREKTLADVDSINSYTYTYQYDGKVKDWHLVKVDVLIKKQGEAKHKSLRPKGRTLFTLEEEMNPMDDIE